MKSAKQQLLRNPDIQPESGIIAEALGEANNAYLTFLDGLENHEIQLEWRYYNDGKAWLGKGIYKWVGVRGAERQVTVFWLSIWDGFFKVTIYMPEKVRSDAMSLPVNDEIKQLIVASKQMGDKLKFFPIVFELNSNELLEGLYTLADFKKNIK